MSKHTTTSSGVGFFGALTIALIVLKLTGYIDWPWLVLVLFPIVIPFLVVFAVLTFMAAIAGIVFVFGLIAAKLT